MLRVFLVLIALLAGATPAMAKADAARDRAKALFIEGRGHFAAGRLTKALTAFEQANAIKPHPLMLFNIAQVYEAMQDLPRSIATLRTFNASDMADADSKRKQATLERTLAGWPRVSLSTVPAGAAVRLGNGDMPARCNTPCTIPVPPGRQTLNFALRGHRPVSQSVRFSKGQAVTFPPVALPPVTGQVAFRTTPAGAQVMVDGRGVPGVTPFVQALRVGAHEVTITLPGHTPITRRFAVAESHSAQAPLVVEAALQRGVTLGQLTVEVSTPGAEIKVDGKTVGVSPMQAPVPMVVGMHRLEVTVPGGDPYEEVVNVLASGITRAKVSFESEPSGPGFTLTQRTVSYGLMGLGGAALIGGAVTGAMALGTSGDLDDCRQDATCGRTQREVALADDVRSGALTTDILLGAGVAIAATGVVLFLLDDGPSATADARGASTPMFTITPTAGGAAAVGHIAF